jgi:hypothetical protein
MFCVGFSFKPAIKRTRYRLGKVKIFNCELCSSGGGGGGSGGGAVVGNGGLSQRFRVPLLRACSRARVQDKWPLLPFCGRCLWGSCFCTRQCPNPFGGGPDGGGG